MAKLDPEKYRYLIDLYHKVDDYLTGNENNEDILPDIVVSFCVVIEKILKIKLYKKNPLLIYDVSKFKDPSKLLAIINKVDKNLNPGLVGELEKSGEYWTKRMRVV